MGVVYLAEHLHLGRKVALKLLPPEFASDERFRERFVRESRVAATIDHANVIPVYDAGEADGHLYISMRYVDGEDLHLLVKREAPLAPGRAIAILDRVAAALDAAHAEGLVHRDVKPANVLIARDGHVFLTDFGLTKRSDSRTGLTGTGLVVGTVSYMAPEQFQDGELDARTDVYSLGCVLYECLTGSVPFRKETEAATMYAHLHAPAPRPSDGRADIPTALDSVVAKAMAKRKEDRFATCGEFARAAQLAADDVAATSEVDQPPIAAMAKPRGAGPRAPSRARRRLLLVAAAIGAAAIAAGVLLLRPHGGPSGVQAVIYKLDNGSIFRVPVRPGAKPQDLATLLAARSKGGSDEWATLSANGQWLLVSTQRFGCRAEACLVIVDTKVEHAEVVRVGGEPQHAVWATVSSAGDVIVFGSADGPHEQDLWLLLREAREWKEPVLLTRDPPHAWNTLPALSRDASRVVFECAPKPFESTAICEVRVDGSGMRLVQTPASRFTSTGSEKAALTHPAYGPAGEIVFESDWGAIGDQVWRLPADAKDATRVTTEGRNFAPCVLADGRIVVIVQDRPGGPGKPEIAVIHADGSKLLPIVTVPRVLDDTLNCSG
jgi:serine/threonine-protein kinase